MTQAAKTTTKRLGTSAAVLPLTFWRRVGSKGLHHHVTAKLGGWERARHFNCQVAKEAKALTNL